MNMKLIDILSGINPILRILCIVVLSVAAHFAVKAIRRISQKMLTMKVDRKAISEENMARRYPKIATIKERVLQAFKKSDVDYAPWMITVNYKVEAA
jgi:uncharacterized membrane protein